ncbi:hypothetical protein As57867_014641, partial [Aphanomyces stellatus]
MVRKKRKTEANSMVKTRGLASSNTPLPVDVTAIDLPTAGAVSLDISPGEGGAAAAQLQLDLDQLYRNLLHAPDTYAQLKVLQLFRSHLKLVITAADHILALSTETQAQFWLVAHDAFRFTFRLYAHPSMKDMRKTILPILDTLALYDAAFPSLAAAAALSMGDVLADELTRFLDAVVADDAVAVDQAIVYLDQILAICEYATAAEALWALHAKLDSPLFGSLIRYCAAQLRFLAAPIVSYHGKQANDDDDDDGDEETTQSSEVVLASDRCLALLKSIIILCTASQKATPAPLLLVRTARPFAAPRALAPSLEDLVQQCLVILETSVVHKDLVTTVGLALTLVLKVHFDTAASSTPAYLTAMLTWLFDAAASPAPSILPANATSRLGATSKLALYRGFLNSVTDASFAFLYQGTPLVEVLVATVLAGCHSTHLNTRMYAFQVLEMYLRRLVHPAATVRLSDATVSSLLNAILLNWEHPAKKINQFMTPMFTHVVALLSLQTAYDWRIVLDRLLDQPEHNRSKYIALGIVLPKLHVANLLARHPALLHGVLAAVANQDVSASAASLFVQILDALRRAHKDNLAAWGAIWVPAVADTLLADDDAPLRHRIAVYVLPVLVKSEPASVGILLDAIRARPVSDTRLWALLELVKHARKTLATPPTLTSHEINLGLVHEDGDIRMAAFDMLCASLKTTSLPDASDLVLVQTFLVTSAKSIAASLRMKLIVGLKAMMLRVREGSRKTCRRDVVTDANPVAKAFPKWIETFVVACIAPGATPTRLIMGLDILQLYGQIFDSSTALHTPAVTKSLLNAMISCWDRVRALSFSILETFPSPLPGYEATGLDPLFAWALTLCCSPRQRESDAGALFMRLLYKQCAHLTFLPARTQQACVRHLLSILTTRLDVLATSTDQSEPPLVHGLLLALRYMLEDTTDEIDATWNETLAALFQALWRAMHMALCVVGDATSGVGTQALNDSYAVVGEVLTTPQLRAKVDCRGHLILDDPDLADGDAEQRAVVGSWLAARETAAVLATAVKTVLAHPGVVVDATAVQRAGDCLLNALFELKHGGAVATVSSAFEDICRALLAHSETHRALGQCPSKWCAVLLDRLEHAEQQFILRRSAGFASSFVALLRAEPRNAAATMLPHVLDTLLRLASSETDAERVRVHALNILKLVAQDAVLAEDVAVYVPPMLTVAVRGFESTSWAVRNSSMMLFA